MSGPFTQEKIENWVSDFCISDAMEPFSPAARDVAGSVLLAFLTGACDVRGIEPEDVEEADLRMALLGPVARLAIPEAVRSEVPAVCGAMLAFLEAEGRLSGGRMLGAFVTALRGTYLERAAGKTAPIVRPGSKLGRNDPCPCGSGKKYKKCCLRE
jgi:hypothetical protein